MLIGIDAHNLEGQRTGVGRYLKNLLHEWSKFNFQFPISNFQFILYFKDKIPADLPPSEKFKFKLLNVGSTAKFIHWDLWRAAKKDKIDILFCPGYIAPLFYKGKIALTLHDIIYEAHPSWFNWQSPADKILLKWVSKISARRASIIFVPSQFSRQEVIRCYGVVPEKVILIYEAADSALFQQPVQIDIEPLKAKYQVKDKFVFYVGSIFSRRHLPEVINAFRQISRPDFQLLIGGQDYTYAKEVNNLAEKINKQLGRQAILRVDFIGDSDLKLLYSACAFFIWLSDYEGFGLPVLEAMAGGAPVITSDATSLKEVAGDAALLIKNNLDINEIYLAMKKLIEDENLRNELVQKGKEQAIKFSWKRCAEETIDKLISSL